MYDPASNLFGGMDQATKQGQGGKYVACAMRDTATLGLYPLGASFVDATQTGDWDQFGEQAGGFAVNVGMMYVGGKLMALRQVRQEGRCESFPTR